MVSFLKELTCIRIIYYLNFHEVLRVWGLFGEGDCYKALYFLKEGSDI